MATWASMLPPSFPRKVAANTSRLMTSRGSASPSLSRGAYAGGQTRIAPVHNAALGAPQMPQVRQRAAHSADLRHTIPGG